MIFFPQLDIFVKCAVGIVERNDESFRSKQKAALEKITAEKREKAVEKGFERRRNLFMRALLGKERGVELHFCQELSRRAKGRMENGLLEKDT